MATSWGPFPKRLFVDDDQSDGLYLRITWHRDSSTFVISHWRGSVCVAATRLPADDVAPLIAVLSLGLADEQTADRTKREQPLDLPRPAG